ncbi:MAG: serine/threonine protein kinase [Vescimonas sp.]
MVIELSIGGLVTLLGIPTAITAFCSWMLQRRITKRDEAQEAREKAREKNEVLIIRSTGAAIALGEATAEALKNGHCNGEMEAALEYARKVKHEQKDFLTEQGIHALY